VRADLDTSDDRMQKKIRNHTVQHVPFLLIAGENDRAAGAVSFRFRDGTTRNGVPVDEAIALITGAIASRTQVSTEADLEPAGGAGAAAAGAV
jgi:threonyl-tRNA synthetase